jgi:hypothetical protein
LDSWDYIFYTMIIWIPNIIFDIEENAKCHDEGTSILDGEGICKEKRVDNSVKIQDENAISLSNDLMDIEETNEKMKTGIQQKLIYQMKNSLL